MEVVLFKEGKIPDVIISKVREIEDRVEYPYSRIDEGLIKYIKDLSYYTDGFTVGLGGVVGQLKCHPEGVISRRFGGSRETHFYAFYKDKIVSFSIEDVDISKRWTIEVVNGFEKVKYIDDWVCLDKEKNYWVKVDGGSTV